MCLLHFRHDCLFHHLPKFGVVHLSEKVNEVVPSLSLSCSGHALKRMNINMNSGLLWSNVCSILSRSCLWDVNCLLLSLFLCSEFLLQIRRRLHFSLGNEISDFLLEMSMDHQLQSAMKVFLVAKCRFLSSDLQDNLQFFRLFNLHLVQAFQHTVSKSVSDS